MKSLRTGNKHGRHGPVQEDKPVREGVLSDIEKAAQIHIAKVAKDTTKAGTSPR